MDPSLKEKFQAIVNRDYAGQARWFLNGFWATNSADAETIWDFVQLAVLVDHRQGKAGNELDELEAHRFLERLGETLTVKDMRDKLREIDIDFNKRMALIEYLIFKFNKPVKDVINAHQGDPKQKEKLNAAEQLVQLAATALDELNARLEEEKQALAYRRVAEQSAKKAEQEARDAEREASERASEAQEREASAVAREASAKATEAKAREEELIARETEAEAKAREGEATQKKNIAEAKAQEAIEADNENKAALAALHQQEKEFQDRKNALDATSKNESLGQVARNKAKNELEQLKSTDPLPLQRAKLNQGATVRKSDKAREEAVRTRDIAENARENAEKARTAAEKARLDAESARANAETARAAAERARAEATTAARAAEAAHESAKTAAAAAISARKDAEAKAAELALAVEATQIARADAEQRFNQAQIALEELRAMPDQSYGDLWWLERELAEKKKYLPRSKQ